MPAMTPTTFPLAVSQQFFHPPFRDGLKDAIWEKEAVYNMKSSDSATEQIFGFSNMGAAIESDIWGTVKYLDIQEFAKTSWTHTTYTLGGMVPKQLIEDDKYIDFTKALGWAIGQGHRYIQDYVATLPFNRAFNSSYTMFDGVELCGAHTTQVSGTSLTNEFTSKSINWANIWDVCMYFENTLIDHAGLPLTDKPEFILFPTNKIKDVARALQGTWEPDTGNRNLDTLTKRYQLKQVPNRLLTTGYWFIGGSKFKEGNHYYTRVAPAVTQTNMEGQGRYGLMFNSRQRLSCGPSNFLYIAGVSS